MSMTPDTPLWTPDPARAAASQLARFIDAMRAAGVNLPESRDAEAFGALHAWSVDHPAEFWAAVWRDGGVIADRRPNGTEWDAALVGEDRMAPPDPVRGPSWFTGACLNFAENLLRLDGDAPALIAWDERGRSGLRSWRELRREVSAAAEALRSLGVGPGDRVAAWMPNVPETIEAMLATAAVGAVWTSCSPDFGVEGVVDRFGQTTPSVLLFCDGYRYGGRVHDCAGRVPELLSRLPSVRHAVMVSCQGDGLLPLASHAVHWADLLRAQGDPPLRFVRQPFDHPLYILYSSGTTGLPKCMVHSAGGTLLQHLKEHRLHTDIRPEDRLFFFTTCGWMM